MKSHLIRALLCAACALPLTAMAGADAPLVQAPDYDEELNQISLSEAAELHEQGVPFYDCNTLEIWAEGHIPGSIFFSVSNWKRLLPEDKNKTIVFYCLNPLCEASETAARQVMKLGYTDVRQVPEGIHGWIRSNRPYVLP